MAMEKSLNCPCCNWVSIHPLTQFVVLEGPKIKVCLLLKCLP